MSNQRRDARSAGFAAQGQNVFGRTQLATTYRPPAGANDSRSFERTMAARREAQGVQDALQSFHQTNSRVMAANESDARVDAMRRMRKFQQQNAEVSRAQHLVVRHPRL